MTVSVTDSETNATHWSKFRSPGLLPNLISFRGGIIEARMLSSTSLTKLVITSPVSPTWIPIVPENLEMLHGSMNSVVTLEFTEPNDTHLSLDNLILIHHCFPSLRELKGLYLTVATLAWLAPTYAVTYEPLLLNLQSLVLFNGTEHETPPSPLIDEMIHRAVMCLPCLFPSIQVMDLRHTDHSSGLYRDWHQRWRRYDFSPQQEFQVSSGVRYPVCDELYEHDEF